MLTSPTASLFDNCTIKPIFTCFHSDNYKLLRWQLANQFFRAFNIKRISKIQLINFFHLQLNLFWLWWRNRVAWFCVAKISRKIQRINIKHNLDTFLGCLALATFLLQTRLHFNGLCRYIRLDIQPIDRKCIIDLALQLFTSKHFDLCSFSFNHWHSIYCWPCGQKYYKLYGFSHNSLGHFDNHNF